MKRTEKIYIETDKGTKKGIKVSKDKFIFPDTIKRVATPFEVGGKKVFGTVQIQSIPAKKPTVKKESPKNTGYFEPILIPTDVTFNSFGDIVKSTNEVSKEIKSIKRPKKRKAGQNLKQENVLDTVLRQGFLYSKSLETKASKSVETKNKRAKNRK